MLQKQDVRGRTLSYIFSIFLKDQVVDVGILCYVLCGIVPDYKNPKSMFYLNWEQRKLEMIERNSSIHCRREFKGKDWRKKLEKMLCKRKSKRDIVKEEFLEKSD